MPSPFLFLGRVALMACVPSALPAEVALALATPTLVPAGTALDLEVQMTGAAQGSGISWTIALLPELPSINGSTRILSGEGSRIPFVAPILARESVVEINAHSGGATVTRQIRVAAAGADAVPGPPLAPLSTAPPPLRPRVTLALSPIPAAVTAGRVLDMEARWAGAPPYGRPYWRVDKMSAAPFNPPVCYAARFGPRIRFIAPSVNQPTVFHVSVMLQDALATRTIRVLPAPTSVDAAPSQGAQASPGHGGASSSSETALTQKRARRSGAPVPPLPARRNSLDTLPSVLHAHVHSFDTVAATGRVSRALGRLARANATELTITNPSPQLDLAGRIESSPNLKRVRFQQMTGFTGRKIVEALEGRRGLTHLALDETCAVTPDELATIGRTHPHLTHLKVQARHVTTAALQSGFTGLIELEVTDGGPELDLRGLVNLRSLKRQNTFLSNLGGERSKFPESLRALELSNCSIEGNRLPRGLVDLRLSNCMGPVGLSGLTELKTLILTNQRLDPGYQLGDVARANPGLTCLQTNNPVGNAEIDSLPSGMTYLNFPGKGLTAPLDLTRFHSLESLDMTDAGFFRAELLPVSLRRLRLCGAKNVDWSHLAAVPLTHLVLVAPKPFKFEGLNPALTELEVEEAEGGTVTRMQRALPALDRLKTLKFTLFKGSADVDPACFAAHPSLQRVETRRNKGSAIRIWNRPVPAPGATASPSPAPPSSSSAL